LSVNASAVTVDFEADTAGPKPNGYQSPQSSLISFSGTTTAIFDIVNTGSESIGQSLRLNGDSDSELVMDFSVNVNSLSLVFGNDDVCCSTAGDRARLTLFLNGVQVGQVFVTLNRNDLPDQTIEFSSPGTVFNRATFIYVPSVGSGIPNSLAEIVDNINFTPVGPTAATVSVSGRVMTAGGGSIMNVRLSLTDSQGNVRTTITDSSGHYQFDDVQAGETYILTATGKRYSFSQPVQVLNINEETNQVNFIANSEKRLKRVF
jgi:hypothetical protein